MEKKCKKNPKFANVLLGFYYGVLRSKTRGNRILIKIKVNNRSDRSHNNLTLQMTDG